CQHNYGTPFTF
nr:immunoglobulin light chain junction region [Macaca mulatta]MOW72897.1 immunoglobulin light chain junction region [Macaca mulatta]MOW72971.1 immunoglobulin light chain junction region [Macaca mulatta]MOW73010.1 immunoglobulin light chain junction region [Macaca mulatta]MOW73096.1 immunoglobulin light chain junction region [Macaca mulatta]